MKTALTATLEIAYEEFGPAEGRPAILMHGFPDDLHAYDQVAPALAASGWRVIVPYLRGYGPTRFRDPITPRSGQQAALGHDLLSLMDGLSLGRAVLAGYDWGGRAACIVAALWPERVAGLVSITGYNIQNIATALRPASPDAEYRYWYQWCFHTERGWAGLSTNRRPFCRNCGSCGRRITASMTPNTSEPPSRSTTSILSMSRSIPTDTAMGGAG
jgi:pimeloyl-ACP methyl ester carboxylesterase